MKEFKGTKGKWFYDESSECIDCIYNNKFTWVCDLTVYEYDSTQEEEIKLSNIERKANAQLIAAAPELLQKLQQLTYIIRQRGFTGNFSDYLKSSDAIINKALGKGKSNE